MTVSPDFWVNWLYGIRTICWTAIIVTFIWFIDQRMKAKGK